MNDLEVKQDAHSEPDWARFQGDVENRIMAVTDEEWIEGVIGKSSLMRYREFKRNRGTFDHTYDNTRGSTRIRNQPVAHTPPAGVSPLCS